MKATWTPAKTTLAASWDQCHACGCDHPVNADGICHHCYAASKHPDAVASRNGTMRADAGIPDAAIGTVGAGKIHRGLDLGVPVFDPRKPAAGTVLRRLYKGAEVVCEVRPHDVYHYAGKTFTSLSSVAKAATGSAWNGFAFFGLKGAR